MNMATKKTRDMVYIGMCSILIAICSWISIPATVPFTLQTMAVFSAVGILGGKRGSLAVLIYILLGALGIPVFSGFSGGMGVLLGTTGGYIFGFLFSALLMWGMECIWGKNRRVLLLSMILGLLVCYVIGTAWFMMVYTRTGNPVSIPMVLGWCVLPFIVPDCIKIAVAMLLSERIRRAVQI